MDDDARLLLLGPEAQAVAWRLSGRVIGGRVAVGDDPEAAVIAICGGAAWAAKGLDDLERADLVAREEGALVLAWEWPTLGAHAPGAATAQPAGAARDPERVAALSRLKAQFSKHALKTAEARLAWLEGDHGRRVLLHLGLTLEDARPLAEAAGRKGGRFGVDRPARGGNPAEVTATTVGGNHGGNVTSDTAVTTVVTPPPPPTPPTPTNKDKSALRGARSDGGNHGGNSAVVTRPPAVTTGGLVDLLVGASSGGVARPDLLMAAELEGVLVECALTPEEARAWGADLGTAQGRKITWPWLRDADALLHGSWLRGHDPARGELPWRRVREGLAVWRHHRAKRLAAEQKPPRPNPGAARATLATLAAEEARTARFREAQLEAQRARTEPKKETAT